MILRRHKRRQLSCLPCREHKLKCDHGFPCSSCVRYQRTERCLQSPAGGTQLAQVNHTKPQVWPAAPTHEQPRSSDNYFECLERRQARITELNLDINLDLAFSIPVLLQTQMGIPQSWNGVFGSPKFWQSQLLKLLPRQDQCQVLMSFFWDNLNCVYAAVHEPSIRKKYGTFWQLETDQVDLKWLALLFAILSVSAVHMPKALTQATNLEDISADQHAQTWHHASRQALFYGGFETKPHITQISVFIISQLYWIARNDSETLNSCLGQTVRNAQALRLDRDDLGFSVCETQLRRRLWWELWGTDTFQSLCNGRSPLIHTKAARIPLPENCDDFTIDETKLEAQPLDQPTDSSSSIWRARAFQIFRKLFADDGDRMTSWEYVRDLDNEIQHLLTTEFPWFFQQAIWTSGSPAATRLNTERPHIVWQHYILHSSIHMQRLRMLRPFMGVESEAYERSIQQATGSLDSYRYLRDHHSLRENPRFLITAYQAFSSAVQLAGLLIVERSPPRHLRDDVQMVLDDLKVNTLDLTIAKDAARLLERLLRIHDSHSFAREASSSTTDSITHDLGPVFGGETTAREYLLRSKGQQVGSEQALESLNNEVVNLNFRLDDPVEVEVDNLFEFFDFDNPLAPSNFETLERWDPILG